MKVDVWVAVGDVRSSIFLETRSVTIDLPLPETEILMRSVVFELPLGARLDGRGPIRVMLEPRKDDSFTVPCQRCEGCGQVANSEEGEPWSFWENLPVKNAASVVLVLVRPIPCPVCGGSGKVEPAPPAPPEPANVDLGEIPF